MVPSPGGMTGRGIGVSLSNAYDNDFGNGQNGQ